MSRQFAYGSLTALAAIAALTCGSAQAQQLAFSAPCRAASHPRTRVRRRHRQRRRHARAAPAAPGRRLPERRRGRHHHRRHRRHLSLSCARPRQRSLRHRRRPRGLHLSASSRSSARPSGRTGSAGRDDRAPALSAAHDRRRSRHPLGARAMYIAGTVYRIHGTTTRPPSARTCRAAASASPMTT